jgi:threonine dehydrogenase-like Zn-dependent dehydrogenase
MTRTALYRSPDAPVPSETQTWNMYGPGIESIGRDGHAETFPVPEPDDDQLLVRVDAVGMCYSDVKLIKQGGAHPKLYNRDLESNPTRLGHEATLTILEVGKDLRGRFKAGQRLAVQPDIYVDGKSTAYGYTIPGGLTQFHLIGSEIFDADGGAAYLIPVDEEMGYAEAALTEPWACVLGAYTQRRRLTPKPGGTTWILGHPGLDTDYEFSTGLDCPSVIVATDIPPGLMDLLEAQSAQREVEIIVRNGLGTEDYPSLNDDIVGGKGFDDIIVLDPRSAEVVSEAARLIARRGTFNMVGASPLDGKPDIDVGRIHYDYTAYLGNSSADIGASYGEERNRCDLVPGGTAVFVGAGGPMGQMHVQRAIELKEQGPALIIATEVNAERIAALEQSLEPLAKVNQKQLITFNPAQEDISLYDFVMQQTGSAGADDVIVSVPVAHLMAEAADLMKPNGMLVLFAGVPNGSFAPLDISQVYLHNAQYTGTSGSRIEDQELVVHKTVADELSPAQAVAAVGGMNAARDGIQAMMEGRFPGKIVIFPQIPDLPLTGLENLHEILPEVAQRMAPGPVWTKEAEEALIESLWRT